MIFKKILKRLPTLIGQRKFWFLESSKYLFSSLRDYITFNHLHRKIESNCSWKRAPRVNKRALGLSRRFGRGRIPSNWELFLTLLIQIKKRCFQKGLFNDDSGPWTLYLSFKNYKIPIFDAFKNYKIPIFDAHQGSSECEVASEELSEYPF